MKIRLYFVVVMLCCGCRAYSPIIDGALADIKIKVVDDRGTAVSGASVCLTFCDTHATVKNKRGFTDDAGVFAATGTTIGEVRVWVRKDGYYETKLRPYFREYSVTEARRTRRWAKGAVENEIILKKKYVPISMSFHEGNYLAIPVTNSAVFFDLEKFAWCPPYGNGKHKDVEMLYETWQSPEKWNWFWRKLTISFPDCVDGYYRMKRDVFSDFRYAYEADTNAVYSKTFVLELDRRKGIIAKDASLPDDEYLIFRTRTSTNSLGQITHANYGRIAEKPGHLFGLRMKVWFNSQENNVNLEDPRLAPQ